MTAEEFAAEKYDLPDSGRWVELIAGRVVTLPPPDVGHGNIVLNFSKALAAHLQSLVDAEPGYACFELGLLVTRNPDTVRFPQISYYTEGDRFAQSEDIYSQDRPALVVEITSTHDRRRGMPGRVREYHDWGIDTVWVADPIGQQVHLHRRGRPATRLDATGTLSGDPILTGFRIGVADLFADPEWWRS